MDIVINPSSEVPIYSQIVTQISSQIINGTLEPGEKLPAIRQISNQLRISVIPVKMAWEELDKQGFIKTVAGSGTFVNALQKSEIQEKIEEKVFSLAKNVCHEAKKNGISKEQFIRSIEEQWKEDIK